MNVSVQRQAAPDTDADPHWAGTWSSRQPAVWPATPSPPPSTRGVGPVTPSVLSGQPRGPAGETVTRNRPATANSACVCPSRPAQPRRRRAVDAPDRTDPRHHRVLAVRIAEALGQHLPTPEQAAVIEAPVEPLLVVAGAGSGRPRPWRAGGVAVANGLVEPGAVLASPSPEGGRGTVPERIRHRLRALHGVPGSGTGTGDRGHFTTPTRATVLTDHGLRLGVEPGARVLGEAGAWQLVDSLVEHWDGDMAGVDSSRRTVVDAVLALAGNARTPRGRGRGGPGPGEAVTRASALPRKDTDRTPGNPLAPVRDVLARLAARRQLVPLVQASPRGNAAARPSTSGSGRVGRRLARDVPEVGRGERDRYRVVLLDEYQTPSHAQLVLLQSCSAAATRSPPSRSAPSIYGWRGASAGNLQRFGCDSRARRTSGSGPSPVPQLAQRPDSPGRREPGGAGSADPATVDTEGFSSVSVPPLRARRARDGDGPGGVACHRRGGGGLGGQTAAAAWPPEPAAWRCCAEPGPSFPWWRRRSAAGGSR